MSTRKSTRLEKKKIAELSQSALVDHIKSLKTLRNIQTLKEQMRSEMIPIKDSVKEALDKQKEKIKDKEQQNDSSGDDMEEEKEERPKKATATKPVGRARKALEATTKRLNGASKRRQQEALRNAFLSTFPPLPRGRAAQPVGAAAAENDMMNYLAERMKGVGLYSTKGGGRKTRRKGRSRRGRR